MKSIKLEFSLRDRKKDVNVLRAESKVPGVIYGSGIENTVVYIEHEDLRKAYNLNNDNLQIEFVMDSKTYVGLFRDVKVDYLKDTIMHFDLFVPNTTAVMPFNLPIKFTGQSLAVKNLGAVLEQYIEAIPVECTLTNLPESLEVDISPLVELGSVIKVKDITAPENVTFTTAGSHSVVSSKAPKRAEKIVETTVGESINTEGEEKEETSE